MSKQLIYSKKDRSLTNKTTGKKMLLLSHSFKHTKKNIERKLNSINTSNFKVVYSQLIDSTTKEPKWSFNIYNKRSKLIASSYNTYYDKSTAMRGAKRAVININSSTDIKIM